MILRAVGAYEYARCSDKFCESHYLDAKVRLQLPHTGVRHVPKLHLKEGRIGLITFHALQIMKEIHQLREQLTNIVNKMYPQDEPIRMDPNMPPPSVEQVQALFIIWLWASLHQRTLNFFIFYFFQELMLRQVIAAGLVDQVARLNTARSEAGFLNEDKAEKQYQYITCRTNEEVYIHPSSFLFGKHDEYVVYRHAILQSCHVLDPPSNC